MISKLQERKRAVVLRRAGKTYREILREVPVAKSTLSLWLRDIGLAKRQRQKLTVKKRLAQLRGGQARRAQRIEKTALLTDKARATVGELSGRELWLLGVALYWAEGAKDRGPHSSHSVDFSNTDPTMIRLFLRWLEDCCNVPSSMVYAHLYIHQYQRARVPQAVTFWSNQTGLPRTRITGVYFKMHNPKTNRKNTGENYYGTLRVRVRRSSDFLRTIQGWIEGCAAYCRIV